MTARIGAPKTGGRKRGSLDKGERQLVTAEMAGDIMTVYKRLGGVKWLLAWAKTNETEFVRVVLSRMLPAAAKDDEPSSGDTFNTVNFNTLGAFETARRVAYALNLGIAAQLAEQPVAEILPREVYQEEVPEPMTQQRACNWRNPVGEMPPEPAHQAPVDDPDRERWASELPLSSHDRADRAMIRELQECDITNYRGSSAEQGGSTVQRQAQVVTRKPTVAEIRRKQSLL